MSETKHAPDEQNEPNGSKETTKKAPAEVNWLVKTMKNDKKTKKPVEGVKLKNDKSGLKQKIVNKVMSWNSNKSSGSETRHQIETELSNDVDNLKLSTDDSDENLCKADWLRARDSLENLLINREKGSSDFLNSRSASTSFSKAKQQFGECPQRSNKNASAYSISKVLAWDPWDKLGRKNRRDNKRRKDKSSGSSKDTSPMNEDKRKDVTAGDEKRQEDETPEDVTASEDCYENYEYRPFQPRTTKSVDFTNEVKVVYFNAEEIIGEGKEPLKKELEQQIRNKEMRRGHCPAMLLSRRKSDDYMSSWFRK